MKKLKVACVIPKRNGGGWFPSSYLSLLVQTYPFSQIVVSEDNSDDGSLPETVALDGHNQTKVVVPPCKLNGMGANIAYGLRHLAPEVDYVLIGSVDDLWEPQFVEILMRSIDRLGEMPAVVFSDRWIIDPSNRVTGISGSFKHPFYSDESHWEYYSGQCRFIIHGALFRADFLRGIIGLLEQTGQCADWFAIAEAARCGRVLYCPIPLIRYRVHPGSTTAKAAHSRAEAVRAYIEHLSETGASQSQLEFMREVLVTCESMVSSSRSNLPAWGSKLKLAIRSSRLVISTRAYCFWARLSIRTWR